MKNRKTVIAVAAICLLVALGVFLHFSRNGAYKMPEIEGYATPHPSQFVPMEDDSKEAIHEDANVDESAQNKMTIIITHKDKDGNVLRRDMITDIDCGKVYTYGCP